MGKYKFVNLTVFIIFFGTALFGAFQKQSGITLNPQAGGVDRLFLFYNEVKIKEKNMSDFNFVLNNLSRKKRFLIFLIIFIILAAAAALVMIYKPFSEKKEVLPTKKLNETVQAPTQEVPQTNPFEETKTNPFKDIKTNPFE